MNRRKECVDRRDQLRDEAAGTFLKFGPAAEWRRTPSVEFYACPVYPHELLASASELVAILGSIPSQLGSAPIYAGPFDDECSTRITRAGAQRTRFLTRTPPTWEDRYLEATGYGSLWYTEAVWPPLLREFQGTRTRRINVDVPLRYISRWLGIALLFYRMVEFAGPVVFEATFRNVENTPIYLQDGRPLPGACWTESDLTLKRSARVSEFEDRFEDYLSDLHREWLRGCGHDLLEEAAQAQVKNWGIPLPHLG
jgi:hypothetical protein